MSIEKRLEDDMKVAMRAKDTKRLTCIRMLRAKLKDKQVELREKQGKDYKLTDDEAAAVLAAYAKQRRDSIDAFREAGRAEMADAEEAELAIVAGYLPKPLSEAELREIVREAVAASGATSAKDMGAVMKLVMPRVKGRADGKQINALVRELLG